MKKWGLCVLLALLIVVAPVFGSGFKSSGPAKANRGDVLGYYAWSGPHPEALPDAVMFWSKDGSAFRISRMFETSTDGTSFPVPAGATLVLPSTYYSVGNDRFVRYGVSGSTAGDTVYAIPLYR